MEFVTGTEKIKELERAWENVLRENPKERKALHERLANLGKTTVDAAIASRGNPSTPMRNPAKVQQWQEIRLGTGGGYAAIHPIKGEYGEKKARRSIGALTAHLENGHPIRKAKAENGGKKVRSRIRVVFVKGYYFYSTARQNFEPAAEREIDAFADELAEKLGG